VIALNRRSLSSCHKSGLRLSASSIRPCSRHLNAGLGVAVGVVLPRGSSKVCQRRTPGSGWATRTAGTLSLSLACRREKYRLMALVTLQCRCPRSTDSLLPRSAPAAASLLLFCAGSVVDEIINEIVFQKRNGSLELFAQTWLRYVRVFAIANPSCVCLSVTFVRPTRGWNFRHFVP